MTPIHAQKRSGRAPLDVSRAEYKQDNNKAPSTSGPKNFTQKLTPIGYG
jgi:hypothetical protein